MRRRVSSEKMVETNFLNDICDDCYEKMKKKDADLRQINKEREDSKYFRRCKVCKILLLNGPDSYSPVENSNFRSSRSPKLPQKVGKKELQNSRNSKSWIYIVCMVVVLFLFIILFFCINNVKHKFSLSDEMEILMKKYPKQNNILWNHVNMLFNEMNRTNDILQSFVLLHRQDNEVGAECFARDLGRVINKIFNNADIAIYEHRNDTTDNGEILVKYMELIKKNKHLIVPKLHKMTSEAARMFHVLCDDTIHSGPRPATIIFTLKDTEPSTINVLERVRNILVNAWGSLPDNELDPLLSRIVRTAARFSGEQSTC